MRAVMGRRCATWFSSHQITPLFRNTPDGAFESRYPIGRTPRHLIRREADRAKVCAVDGELSIELQWASCAWRRCYALVPEGSLFPTAPADRYCAEHKLLAELDRIDGTAEDVANFDF